MSQEEEMLEVSPTELEFAFAQAARFGAFIHFTYSQQDLCKKVFEEFGEPEPGSNENIDLSSESDVNKRRAITKLAHYFMTKTPDGSNVGKRVQEHFSELYYEKLIWDHVEVFNVICNAARDQYKKKGKN